MGVSGRSVCNHIPADLFCQLYRPGCQSVPNHLRGQPCGVQSGKDFRVHLRKSKLLQHFGVTFQSLELHKSGFQRGVNGVDGGKGLFNGSWIGNDCRMRRRGTPQQPVQFPQDQPGALLLSGNGAHNRNTQPFRKPGKVYPDSLAPGFIHQVDANQNAGCDFQNLQNEIQIPFQAGGVAHHHHGFRRSGTQVASGHLLLGRMGHERVGARKIGQPVGFRSQAAFSLSCGNGFPGPVAGVLPQAGEGIEQGGFSYIWVSGQGNGMTGQGDLSGPFFRQTAHGRTG